MTSVRGSAKAIVLCAVPSNNSRLSSSKGGPAAPRYEPTESEFPDRSCEPMISDLFVKTVLLET
eukprot:CAMPEP_0206498034 /NCGR_PEP_ID=MMETSP0324_2-20121206/50668_1 /ASSEMBLY_ACC=CAM_ASM_000836 /TAXON_ID=2866 /ORGANISM="Crypthecodinium cohnii, Strain Seligo" /LENGTH=63 /DNA_ID=CAMNT_0053983973 /DNA_START=539 /DNA_END=726 /DNA_ORIENTATION=+